MNIGELFVSLGFKADTSKLDKMKEGMESAGKKALALKIAVVATVVAVEQLVAASMHSAESLHNFSLQTGLSIQQLQKWSYIAEQSGIAGDSVVQAVQGIQQAQASIKLGGGNLRPFQLLGISPYEDPFKVMEQLKNKIKGMDPAIATNILSELGVGQEFLSVLRGGNVEFTKLNKQFTMTKKETDNLVKLNQAWKDLWFSLKGVRDRLTAINFKPFLDFVRAVKNSVLLVFELSMKFFDLYNSSKRLQGIFIILGAIMLIAFAPVTAIIIAIILILDDLWTGLHGGDSVTRDILKWWDRFKAAHPIIVDLIKIIGLLTASFLIFQTTLAAVRFGILAYNAVMNIAKIISLAFSVITPFGLIMIGIGLLITAIVLVVKHWTEVKNLFAKGLDWAKITAGEGFEKFKNIFKSFDFSEMFKGLGETLSTALMPIMKLILSIIGKALGLKDVGDSIKNVAESLGLKDIFGSKEENPEKKPIMKTLGTGAAKMVGSLGLGNILNSKDSENKIISPTNTNGGNTVTNNQAVNIKIDGSRDPRQVGEETAKAVKEYYQKQVNKTSYGVPVSVQ